MGMASLEPPASCTSPRTSNQEKVPEAAAIGGQVRAVGQPAPQAQACHQAAPESAPGHFLCNRTAAQ